MPETGDQGTFAAPPNTSLVVDDSTESMQWSEARGPHGDLFQRHLIKPFVAAYAQFLSTEAKPGPLAARRLMRALYSATINAVREEPEDPEEILSKQAGSNLAELAVLDLGCGEAFLGRWLVRQGATYLGIDQNEGLLGEARRKADEADLAVAVRKGDIITVAGEGLPVFEGGQAPNLVTLTGVVDHIEHYEATMKALSAWVAPDGSAPDFIVATLNPFFFRSLHDLDRSRADGGQVRVPVHVAVSGSNSRPFLRWPGEYERAFVDAGFHVLSSLSPSVGLLQAVTGKDIAALCGRREAVEELPTKKRFSDDILNSVKSPVYVGPFILWLLRPRPIGMKADSDKLLELVSNLNDSEPVETLVAELCRLGVPLLPVLKLGPGEAIEHAGGLGGRCYVVLENSASRWQQLPSGGRTSAQVFGPGDLIGEFEAGGNLVADRFKDDVAAGQLGCTVVVLEKAVIDQALGRPGAELAARLFRTLRGRMSQYSWTRIPAQTVSTADSAISHVARAILFGLSHEAHRSASARLTADGVPCRLGPPVIVATLRELGHMIYGGPGGENDLKKSVDKLVRGGIIDYGVWSYKHVENHRTTEWTKELSHGVWEALVHESFNEMLGKELPKDLADQLFRKPGMGDKTDMILGNGGTNKFSRNADYFTANLVRAGLGVTNDEIVTWMANLAAAQSALYCQRQSSMFVRDVALLREIASCPDMSFATNSGDASEGEEAGMVRARWIEYADVTVSHVITQLREDGFFSTTAAAVGISPNVAANLM